MLKGSYQIFLIVFVVMIIAASHSLFGQESSQADMDSRNTIDKYISDRMDGIKKSLDREEEKIKNLEKEIRISIYWTIVIIGIVLAFIGIIVTILSSRQSRKRERYIENVKNTIRKDVLNDSILGDYKEKMSRIFKSYYQGQAYYYNRRYEKAIEVFSSLKDESLLANNLFFWIGKCNYKIREYDEAIKNFKLSYEANKNSDTLISWALSAKGKGDIDHSNNILERGIKDDLDSSQVYYRLAQNNRFVTNLRKSSKYIEKALELNSDNCEYLCLKSTIHKDLGELGEAKKIAEKAYEISKQKRMKNRIQKPLCIMITIDREMRVQFDILQNSLNELFSIGNGLNSISWSVLIYACLEYKKMDRAKEYLGKASLTHYKNDTNILNIRAQYFIKSKKYEQAKKTLMTAYQFIDPGDLTYKERANYYYLLLTHGDMFYEQADYEAAIKRYNEAKTKITWNNGIVESKLALSYFRLDKLIQGQRHLLNAIKILPVIADRLKGNHPEYEWLKKNHNNIVNEVIKESRRN